MLFALAGVFQAGSVFASAYSSWGVTGPDLPVRTLVAWFDAWVYMPALVIFFVFLPLLFPTGKLPSRAWRPVVVLGLVAAAAVIVSPAVSPGPLDSALEVPNPIGVGSRSFWSDLSGLGMLMVFASSALAFVSLWLRFRRSRGLERLQLKWFVFATALLPLALLSFIVLDAVLGVEGWDAVIAIPAYLAPPIAAGVAILRYRLYDIDRIVNRTLVYGSLTVLLAALYYLGVVVLQALLGGFVSGSQLAVAASTLAATALFRPLRNRIQNVIDRRFDRHKYDAERVVERFAARLRYRVDLDSVSGDLLLRSGGRWRLLRSRCGCSLRTGKSGLVRGVDPDEVRFA